MKKVILYDWPASQNHLDCRHCALIEPSEDGNQGLIIPACVCLLNLKNNGENDCSKYEPINNEQREVVELLNTESFNFINAGDIFMKGVIVNSPEGIYMTDQDKGKMLKWIAVKGYGNDWSIYIHWAYKPEWWIKQSGDKITLENHIRRLVPCTDEVFKRYRY